MTKSEKTKMFLNSLWGKETIMREEQETALEFIELLEEDREAFNEAFTRENVIRAIDQCGSFQLSYRLLMDGKPIRVSMKAVCSQTDPEHIIVGISTEEDKIHREH